jgi:hypothetical protein
VTGATALEDHLEPCKTACEEHADCTGFTWRALDKMCELRSGTKAAVSEIGNAALIIK